MIDVLLNYKENYPDCIIYIYQNEWERIESDYINDLIKFEAYLITLKDGQIIDYQDEISGCFPENTYYIEDREEFDNSELPYFSKIIFHSNNVICTHSFSIFSKYNKRHYKTCLQNKGNKSFKVNRFAVFNNSIFNKIRKRPVHSSYLNGWFLSQDFKMWYQQKGEWIMPNEKVCDMTNWGNSCFWIYEIEYKSGEIEFVAFKK
ncbi:hypothetical protein N9P38_01250 [Flavobacteriales bacterium]|nr:hypothetical protein [Flavobacteriales bacterium]MDA9262194.1 hypothetical protein [bacterium]